MKNENIIKQFEKVLKSRLSSNITKGLYDYLHIRFGCIAHYDRNGFMAHYEDLRDLVNQILRYEKDFNLEDIEKKIVNLARQYKNEIDKEFERKEKEEDLNTIRILISKWNLPVNFNL